MRHRLDSDDVADPEPRLDDALSFLRVIWRLAHALDARSKWMASNQGVTGPQRMAIRMIGRAPGLPAGTLARHLHLHPSTVSGILGRLEERGLVARARDTSDSRRAMLVLTRLGRTVDLERSGTVERSVETVLNRYDATSVALVRRILADLARELDGPDGDRGGTALPDAGGPHEPTIGEQNGESGHHAR